MPKSKTIRRYKPTTPSRRGATAIKPFTKNKPRKKLLAFINKRSGRDSKGRISVRHRGAGAKKLYRSVDFKQLNFDKKATVIQKEYDPNRSANILLIQYEDGKYSYILEYKGAEPGHEIITSEKVKVKAGNRTRLKNLPLGTEVHNVELKPLAGGILLRSAGSYGIIEAKEDKYVTLKMPSKETRMVLADCFASVGSVGNPEYSLVRIGSAGRKRHMGIRPTVRGLAMHPGAHPHGGGEGKAPIGLKHQKTYRGKPARGVKTRKKHKYSNKLIIKRRKK